MKSRNLPTEPLRRRFARLAASLGKTGWVLVGTIRPRRIPSRRGGSKTLLGPYYQWTFKDQGKTVTINLSASQVRAFQRAIDQNRRIEQRLAQMRSLSRLFLERTTEGVKRRKTQTLSGLHP
jgi:hypothetical protein